MIHSRHAPDLATRSTDSDICSVLPARPGEPHNMRELLGKVCTAAEGRDEVSLEQILNAVGRRSFGPLLLLCGAIIFSPLSGVLGLSTAIALIVLLSAVQLLLRRQHIWLPRWILRQKMARSKILKVMNFLHPPARFVDRLAHPRLGIFTGRVCIRVVALLCIVIALAMPLLEVVLFANSALGAALAVFGLALIARDGLLVLFGIAVVGSAGVLAIMLI